MQLGTAPFGCDHFSTHPASNATAGWWRTDMTSLPSCQPPGPGVVPVVRVGDVADDGERGHLGHAGVRGPCEDPDQKKEKNPSGCRPVAEHWLRFASEVADGNRPFGRWPFDLERIGSPP